MRSGFRVAHPEAPRAFSHLHLIRDQIRSDQITVHYFERKELRSDMALALQGLPDVRWSVQAEVSNDLKMVRLTVLAPFSIVFLFHRQKKRISQAEKADFVGRKSC